jgi:hypothetical protein
VLRIRRTTGRGATPLPGLKENGITPISATVLAKVGGGR